MNKQPIEIVRGSGNVFLDFDYPDADVRQAKAIMGAQIIKILDKEALSTRQAEAKTESLHSEFSRIRQAKFSRFTIDRLMTTLHAHCGSLDVVSSQAVARPTDISLDSSRPIKVHSALAGQQI